MKKIKKRFSSIDFMKGLGLVLMVQIHLGMYLTSFSQKNTALYSFMNKISYVAAPLFLMAVGIGMVISFSKRREKYFSHEIKRSLFLIVLGLLFINIWNADIIHYIGFFILISFSLLNLKKFSRFVIANIFLLTAPILLLYIDYMSGWNRLAYRFANFWTFEGFFKNLIINGFYPIFPWIFYVILGGILGEYLLESINKKREDDFCILVFMAGLLFTLTGILMHYYSNWQISFYPASVSYILFCFGISLLILGLSFFFLDYLKKNKLIKFFKPIIFLGTVSLTIYIFHVILGLGYFYLTGTFNRFSLLFVIPYMISLLVVLSFICYYFVVKFGYGPLEYFMRKFYG